MQIRAVFVHTSERYMVDVLYGDTGKDTKVRMVLVFVGKDFCCISGAP